MRSEALYRVAVLGLLAAILGVQALVAFRPTGEAPTPEAPAPVDLSPILSRLSAIENNTWTQLSGIQCRLDRWEPKVDAPFVDSCDL